MNYVLASTYVPVQRRAMNFESAGARNKKRFIQGGLVNKGGHLVLNPGMPAPPSDFPLTQALLCIMLAAPFIY